MRFPVRGLSAAAALALLAVPSALAQNSIPTVVVSPYIVTTPIARAGSSVSVIGRKQLEQSGAATVVDVLRTVPGLTVTERGGAGGQTQVSLRGAEAQHTLVLIDGVRVNDPSSARDDFDFALFSVTDIERIEVLRGPQSAIYGSEAVGGVINIITRRPSQQLRASATVEGGSYGTRRATTSISKGNDHARMLFSGTYFANEGFSRVGDRDNGEKDGTEKYAGTLRGVINGRDGKIFEFGLDGYHQASDIDKSSSTDAAGYTSNRDLLNGFGRVRFNNHDGKLANAVTVFASRSTRSFAEPSKTTFYRGGNIGAEYQGVLKLDTGSLLLGLRGEQESAWRKKSTSASPDYDAARYLYAGYLLYQLPIDQLNLSFAARHDGEIDGPGFTTGRATAVYEIPEAEARIRGSLGTGAKRPTSFQLSYNSDLKPETSIGADLGFEKTLFDGRLTIGATGFWNRFSDMIDWDGDFFSGTYKNVANAETAGVEVAVRSRIIPGKLTGTASYTYLHSRDLATGLPLQRRPEHSGKVSLTYTGIRNLEATISATLMGSRTNNDAATVILAPYAKVDLNANYRVNGNLNVFARVENLFNETYQDVSGYNTPGLSAYVGLNWRN